MSRRRWATRWLLFLVALIVCVGCGASTSVVEGTNAAPTEAGAGETAALGASLSAAPSIDRRPALLAELGGPDAFVITVDEIDGTLSRFESWSYFAAGTQIDLVDGEVLWDIEIEGIPDGSWLPLMYDPSEFTMMATRDDTLRALVRAELVRVDIEGDLDVEGAEIWAGEQLLLGFVDDRLIYVETFPLAPGEPQVAG